MKCKVSDCYNEAENGEKYCKYHIMKRTNKNRKIYLGSSAIITLLVGAGIKRILKKK